MTEQRTLMTGLAYGESPRWHDGRLWFCHWGAQEVVALEPAGDAEVVLRVPTTLPFCIDWLPDGRLLVVCGPEARVLRREDDGSLVEHADLSAVASGTWNEIVTDEHGNAYVDGGGSFEDGLVALVRPDGSAVAVADGLAFANGMALTPDGSTLIVAESHGGRLTAFDVAADGTLSGRRVWADLGDAAPDGVCLDADGAVWYADVPHRRCVRVAEGGEVLDTIEADRGCFSCALGGPDGRTLYITAAEWRGMEAMSDGARTGVVLAAGTRVPSPAAT